MGEIDPAWITALVALIVAVCGCLAWAARWAWRILSRTTRFLDDYFGEPPRDGLPGRPGVMARLHKVELMVSEIRAEVFPNSGHSLRDIVHQTAEDVAAVKSAQDDLAGRIDLSEHRCERPDGN